MQEGLGQRMHIPHGINLCFATSSMPLQVESSIELGTGEVNPPVTSEKLSSNSQAVNDAEGVEGTDMNGKSVQKPKRKKHRPKVIKEGQSAKLQKPKTPKPPKENGNQPTGKRKYVRRKGLSTPAEQIPSGGADTHTRAIPGVAQRCLDFDVEDQHRHLDLVSQTQETEIQSGPGDTQPSISGVERSNVQVSFHWGGTSSSISSVDPIVDIQGLQADCMPKRVNFDLNNSIVSQMPTNYSSLMDGFGQIFQYDLREKVQTNQLLDSTSSLPVRRVSHLTSSVDHMQHPSAYFDQYISTSQDCIEKTPRYYQMLSSYGIPENMTAASQYNESLSIGGNFNPEASIGEGAVIKQMAQYYRLPQIPFVPPKHNERDVINGNLNEFSVKNDYLKFSTNSNYQTGAAFGFHDSPSYSDVLAMGKKREHNAISGHEISFGIDFINSNRTRKFCNDDRLSASSQTSYFPEACKRMRPEDHINQLNGTTGKLSSSSAFSDGFDTNKVSAMNHGIDALADIQRLIAREKSQASQQMFDFITSQNNMIHDKGFTALPNEQSRSFTAQNIPLPGSTVNTQLLSGTVNPSTENYIQSNAIHQHQCLENIVAKVPVLSETHNTSIQEGHNHCTATTTDEHVRTTSDEVVRSLTQRASQPATNGNYNINSSGVTAEANSTEKPRKRGRPRKVANTNGEPKDRGTKGSSIQEGHNHCTAATTDENVRTTSDEVVRSLAQRASQPATNGNYNLNSSGVTAEANSTEKPRKRGRPRKVSNPNGEPKERGTKGKQIVGHAKPISPKGSCTDFLKANGITCASEASTGITPRTSTVESKSSDHKEIHGGVISQATAASVDTLDGIIEKIKLLSINGPDKVVAEVPKNALVPYEGEFGALVAFERKTKKTRSRAKVNIDPVTTMMWNLLMGPDMGDGAEELDKDKEKWLDEERRVFRGRVDSFIARMHLVQGDRRFSRWKGSVVDSVVGVFLTQNVSDHLSSSAFMAVAAKFPAKTEVPGNHVAEMSHTPPEQKDICSGLFGDSIKLQGKIFIKEISDVRPLITTEDNEESNSNELIGSSTGYGVNYATGGCHVSYGKPLTGSHGNGLSGSVFPTTGISSVVETEDGSFEDVISSQNSAVSAQNSPDYVFHKTDAIGSSLLQNFTEEGYIMRNISSGTGSSTDYTGFLPIQDPKGMLGLSEYYGLNPHPVSGVNKGVLLDLNRSYQPLHTSMAYVQNSESDFTGVSCSSHIDKSFYTGPDRVNLSSVTQSEASLYPTDPVERHQSSALCDNQHFHSEVLQGVASGSTQKLIDAQKEPSEAQQNGSKAKKVRGRPKKNTYDWDSLRKEVLSNGGDKQRSHDARDTVNWEAVRQAEVREISETIRERGMNNMLAERIKEFLNRLVTDHGSIDLEWLRDVQPDKAKDFLLSIRGLGLKSVECVRLLTLHHMAFPVDTNVGRICVRLGWVPLQPLPESLQLHLLEMYPMLEHIQKYLWPRLCKLDQRTLYELHYQMITFGKVFCTKSKPNCNSCPMRAECKHFASAFASARLALPAPEEKRLATSDDSNVVDFCHQTYINSGTVGQLEWSANYPKHAVSGNHQPIIEEPLSPEPESENVEAKEGAIEDFFCEDPDEIPTINLNIEEFTQNLKNYMQANNVDIEYTDMSKALVAITPDAASIPTPKLKNISRLRTEHQVYELPDSHPLLEGFEQREPDDPCPYLLSIWTPGETAQSTDAPKTFCDSGETGRLCGSSTCFSCNSIQEMQAQKVRGTLLIPCRTAMRGSFPLNGTYFQVNEVFADHYSSQNPVDVPRSWIWNLPRRTVYFGTSVPTIFRGLTTEQIQQCFWRGFVCVRGFDRTVRAPRPLYARLHFPASKVVRGKKPGATEE